MLPDDIVELANGRLSISVTKVSDGKNYVLNNFVDKSELIKVIAASCFIPIFSGNLPERVRGQRVIDGGFSVNLIKHSANTITVSPLAGDADICPLDDSRTRGYDITRLMVGKQGHDLTFKNLERLSKVLYPPSSETLAGILEQGFRDAHRFLRKHGLVSCSQCMTVRSTVHHEDPEGDLEPAAARQKAGASARPGAAHVHGKNCRTGSACEQSAVRLQKG